MTSNNLLLLKSLKYLNKSDKTKKKEGVVLLAKNIICFYGENKI